MSAKTRVRPARERARDERRVAALRKKRLLVLGTASIGVLFAALAVSLIFGRGGSQPGEGSEAGSRSAGPRVIIDRGAIEVGKPFPAFSFTDIDGRLVTKDSLSGKPTFIWFTTSYCIPCQQGAASVARLDDRLGGDAFNVVVVFVDPSEGRAALTSWRERFGRSDWLVALDPNDTFARAVHLRALDTKFLLDAQGDLQDVNLYPVDPAYLALLQQAAGASS
jgi:thiol-disulfide isomerase/thioredoxin